MEKGDLIVKYDQILYLSDLIATNGEVLSNIVPHLSDLIVPNGGMIKYYTCDLIATKMEMYCQILYLSDLIVPNGELGSNIIPQWPDSNKWRGIVKYYFTSVTKW